MGIKWHKTDFVTLQFYLQEEILLAKVNKYIISEYGNKSEVQGAMSETIRKDLIYIGHYWERDF